MTENRPTPETDAETMRDEYDHVDSDFGPFVPSNTVPADFARKLERERDEARDFLRNESTRADAYMYGMDHARRECANLEEIIRGEWPEDQAYELIRNAKEAAILW